jgi:ribosome-binding ATPase YchF (GTP1/OBG family)
VLRAPGPHHLLHPSGQDAKGLDPEEGRHGYDAAGLIHSDIQQGFIKAEVVSLKDFLEKGGMHGAKEAGVVLTEGREFVLRDKDVIVVHFR